MRIQEGLVKISVRDLVEFVLRSGSINQTMMSSNRAVLGTLAHKKIQNSMDAHYEAEVKLSEETEVEGIVYIVEGRADGIMKDLVSVTVDEIKTTTRSLDSIDENFNPLHWAQAKCYAYFYAKQNGLSEIQVRLTYYHIETKKIKYLIRGFFFGELEGFYKELIKKYHRWIKYYMAWTKKRDGSLKKMVFPFETYRKGQRALAVQAYKAIQNEERLYINAPTGIGKTMSTLFPALKAMGEGYGGKIFYLTAKTITRTVAEEAVQKLYGQGMALKVVTLTAKDKICFLEKTNCNPNECLWAKGHYDRVDEAIFQMLQEESCFNRATIEAYAKKYEVCPFELSLDLATWADVIICDYNYVFDPTVALKRFIDDKESVFLVDEAHNLVDRAREMYSATLYKSKCLRLKKLLGKSPISKELSKLNDWFLDLRKDYIEVMGTYISQDIPKSLYTITRKIMSSCDKQLQKGNSLLPELIDFYFELYQFNKIYELFDEHYMAYGETNGHEVSFKLFCLDPSKLIEQVTEGARSTLFFSATLLPIQYYKYMLGGETDKAIAFESPFKMEHALRVIGGDVSTKYRHRNLSYEPICEYINQMVAGKQGNYMVFFPSYEYMKAVYEVFIKTAQETIVLIQSQEMKEEEKEAFLNHFKAEGTKSLIAFCVLGGVFSEGIDLTGERLIGVMVVGVGLPQLNLERDLIKNYFEKECQEGYHYAYTYPGMNKVLQAVGRLIRTEEDKGAMILIDERFKSPLYQALFPPEFKNSYFIHAKHLPQLLNGFWKSEQKD